ncbi:PaaI family thioesterase [Sphingomonas sp.]|uniref:PaaI family thioesterase n=1 Tax=Sphingomonas sp. TaxID=28214 RepID=UPI0037503299
MSDERPVSAEEDAQINGGAFDARRFSAIIGHYGHSGAIGFDYVGHGDDWFEAALPWREELVGVPETGLLASGAIVSLIDLAAGISVWVKQGEFRPAVTLDLRIDYLRPARKHETVFARCRCIKITRSVSFVEGVAHVGDRDDPIARAALTFMTT